MYIRVVHISVAKKNALEKYVSIEKAFSFKGWDCELKYYIKKLILIEVALILTNKFLLFYNNLYKVGNKRKFFLYQIVIATSVV